MVEIITKTYRIENETLNGYDSETGVEWEATGINGTITIDDCERIIDRNITIDGISIYDKNGNSLNEKFDLEGFKEEIADNINISYDLIVLKVDSYTLVKYYYKGE